MLDWIAENKPQMKLLISWLGHADINQMKKEEFASLATIAVKSKQAFNEIWILSNEQNKDIDDYCSWLLKKLTMAGMAQTKVKKIFMDIASPVDYPSIAEAVKAVLEDSKEFDTSINLTSGTPAMTSISILLGEGLYGCTLLQAQDNQSISTVTLPFNFHAEYKAKATKQLISNITDGAESVGGFEKLVANSDVMKKVLSKALKVSYVDVPCLILGETGTGKEVLANAIHMASDRNRSPFIGINCGAIPENLIESQLFGHVKGAFTGAISDYIGAFAQAENGTLFLDEVGELTLAAQTKLLRVLQENVFTPIGGGKPIRFKARIIAATHRNLQEMVREGTFREDLYYRLNIGVLNLPPLRQRKADIPQLIDDLLDRSNNKIAVHPNIERKKICDSAINIAINYQWKGNVRELSNVIDRVCLWSENETITIDDFKEQIDLLDADISEDEIKLEKEEYFDLPNYLENRKKKIISDALLLYDGNKTKAAKYLRVKNRQTLTNWLDE